GLPAQKVDGAEDDARGGRDAAEGAQHQDSPKPRLMRSAIESSAISSSGPLARTVRVEPHSAASIITPMMLFPLTSRSSRTMVISLWNLEAVLTISAAGRAWRPFLLVIWTDRSAS